MNEIVKTMPSVAEDALHTLKHTHILTGYISFTKIRGVITKTRLRGH